MLPSRRDVAKTVKSLNVLLQSLRDQQVVVTLRNDSIVKGTIISVDGDMNMELRDASLCQDPFYVTNTSGDPPVIASTAPSRDSQEAGGETTRAGNKDQASDSESSTNSDSDGDDNDDDETELYSYFIVKGSRVRHIDLPAELDLVNSARSELERIRNRRKQWSKRDIVSSRE